MKLFKIYTYLISILFCLNASFSNAYVLSSYIWQMPNGAYRFVIGECHDPSDVSIQHSDCLEQLFTIFKENSAPLTVVVECPETVRCCVYNDKRETLVWLRWLCKLPRYGTVNFQATDLRLENDSIENAVKCLTWMHCGAFSINSYLIKQFYQFASDYAQEMLLPFSKIEKVSRKNAREVLERDTRYWQLVSRFHEQLKVAYKQMIPEYFVNIQQLFNEVELTIRYIQEQNQAVKCAQVDQLIKTIKGNFVIFKNALKDCNIDLFTFLLDLYMKDRSYKPIAQLCTLFNNFTYSIADAGFLLKLEKYPTQNSLLYCGDAHAQVINQLYAKMGATLVTKIKMLDNEDSIFDTNNYVVPTKFAEHCNEFIKRCCTNNNSALRESLRQWKVGRFLLDWKDRFIRM